MLGLHTDYFHFARARSLDLQSKISVELRVVVDECGNNFCDDHFGRVDLYEDRAIRNKTFI